MDLSITCLFWQTLLVGSEREKSLHFKYLSTWHFWPLLILFSLFQTESCEVMEIINISTVEAAGDIVEECDDDCWDFFIGFWIEGLLVPAIALFGIVGNIACVFVFNHKSVDLKPSFSNILKCLSIYDILFLVSMESGDMS